MPEWRKIFTEEYPDFAGLGAMEVCSSTEMGASGASHLGTGDRGTKNRPKQTTISPGKRACVHEHRVNSRVAGLALLRGFVRGV
jgi:hypothetical protein